MDVKSCLRVVFSISLIFVCGCGGATSDDDFAASHERMLTALEEIRLRTPHENAYLGDAKARQLKRALINLPASTRPSARIQYLLQLGQAQLIVGETEQAIEQFQKGHEIYRRVEGSISEPDKLHDQLDFQTAVAYLRLAENENCVRCRNSESCILPIRGAGVHQFTTGSEKAIEYLTSFLQRNPEHNAARWLLNVAYMTLGEYPHDVPERWRIPVERFQNQSDFPRFKNISDQLGLDVLSLSGGTVVEDFNGDGWLDVMTSTWSTAGQIRCFLSDGDGTFQERTDEAGLKGLLGGLNLIHADYDNDGDNDVLVLRGAWLHENGRHPNSLLQNDGRGNFRDVAFAVGLGEHHYPTQTAAWADYDNDGDLDLFVGNEIGRCELFQNNGSGNFKEVAGFAGVADSGAVKGSAWGDYDNDRYADLYTSNIFGVNRLYHNNGDGTFTDVAAEAGVTGPKKSFPAWFWDYNNDGALDIFVAAYWQQLDHFANDYISASHKAETDRLYQGDGKGGFRDVSEQVGLNRVTLPMGSNFGDLDNDGFPDFYLGTGYPGYDGLIPNRMFHNQQGRRFVEVTNSGGFGHLQKGHGVAFADYDHDGDQDVFIEMGGAYPGDAFANALFENPGFKNQWISIKLIGVDSNRSAIGARIRVVIHENGRPRNIYKWVNTGGSFGSNPLRQHIGLGTAASIDRLEIYWPRTDVTQTFKDVPVNQMIEITEGESTFRPWGDS